MGSSPRTRAHRRLQGVGVTDHLVQDADDLVELGTLGSVFLPAVQHELVQARRAVHGGGETVALLDRLYDLEKNRVGNLFTRKPSWILGKPLSS